METQKEVKAQIKYMEENRQKYLSRITDAEFEKLMNRLRVALLETMPKN